MVKNSDFHYDDVGSFPLPDYIDTDKFKQFYWAGYKGLLNNADIFDNRGIYNFFIHPFLQSFQLKLNAGVEIINYPQHMDMYTQFLKPIEDYEVEPSLIDPEKGIIPELFILKTFAKDYYERTGNALEIKVCITGPIELYIKKHGFTLYPDIAMNYAKSLNSILKKSIINTKDLHNSIISIDEPSFGYVDLFNIDDDAVIKAYDKTVEGLDAVIQIHIHTLKKYDIPIQTTNIDVLTCEYASDHSNIISKRDLDQNDKFIRVGITRTNINSKMAEKLDAGASLDEFKTFEGTMSLIDTKEFIKKNLLFALEHYEDRVKFVGPDCGLKGWNPPQVAYELLRRTYEVIKDVRSTQ
jgi:5-methyltetrahydropteroyltriglutamate--homocysteine methyltransferase